MMQIIRTQNKYIIRAFFFLQVIKCIKYTSSRVQTKKNNK